MLKVGIIGAGIMGTRRAEAARRTPGIELVGIYDTDLEKAAAFAERQSCMMLWEPPTDADLVVVATPNSTHVDLVREALSRGQHVLCEKPLALNGDNALELAIIAADANLMLRSGFHMRHYPGVQRLREMIQNDDLGTVVYTTVEYGSQRDTGFADSWRCNPIISGGGVLVDQGIHVLDLIWWLLGEATVQKSEVHNTRALSDKIEDDAHVLLDVKSGLVNMHASWVCWPARFSIRLIGTKARCSLSGLEARYGPQRLTLEDGDTTFALVDIWAREWLDILKELRGAPHVGDDGYAAVALLDEARRYPDI